MIRFLLSTKLGEAKWTQAILQGLPVSDRILSTSIIMALPSASALSILT